MSAWRRWRSDAARAVAVGRARGATGSQAIEPVSFPCDSLRPSALLWSVVLAVAGLVLLSALVGVAARDRLLHAGAHFVALFGGFGVALGYLVPDALNLPVPNDLVSLLGRAGGLTFAEVVMWGSAGSVLGGALGYGLGRALGSRPIGQRFLNGRGARLRSMLERDGGWIVALFAITPLPYSLAAWAAGAARMGFVRFLVISQLRVVRVAGYLYLIERGLVSLL